MKREEIKSLPREEKISLLRGLTNGTVEIIGGELVDMGTDGFVGIITRDGKQYLGQNRDAELPPGFGDKFEGSSIVIPDNGRQEW